MPTEQPSRILFRLPESYEEEAEKKGVLDGLSDYPIPAERPMLVHRGYWKGRRRNTSPSQPEIIELPQTDESGGRPSFIGPLPAPTGFLGPPTPPPLPPPPAPLSSGGTGSSGLLRWARSSPLSVTPAAPQLAVSGSNPFGPPATRPSTSSPSAQASSTGRHGQHSNNHRQSGFFGQPGASSPTGTSGATNSTAPVGGVDSTALNRQQATEFFNNRVARDSAAMMWHALGNSRRNSSLQPDQAGSTTDSSASVPPVIRRIRNRSHRGRRQANGPGQTPPHSGSSSHNGQSLIQQAGNLLSRRTITSALSGVPGLGSANGAAENDTPGATEDAFNFFFAAPGGNRSFNSVDEADDEATTSTTATPGTLRRRRNLMTTINQNTHPPNVSTGQNQQNNQTRRNRASSLLDWASSVISTGTARNSSFFRAHSRTRLPLTPGVTSPMAGMVFGTESRSPAGIQSTGAISQGTNDGNASSGAEYLGLDVGGSNGRTSRRSSSPLFDRSLHRLMNDQNRENQS